jgi:hypothetical protein
MLVSGGALGLLLAPVPVVLTLVSALSAALVAIAGDHDHSLIRAVVHESSPTMLASNSAGGGTQPFHRLPSVAQ